MIRFITTQVDYVSLAFGLGCIVLALAFISLRRANKALHKSNRKLIGLFESANDVILFADSKGNILDINPIAEQLTGYTREELLGSNVIEDFLVPDDRKKIKKVIKELLDGNNQVYEARWMAKDGHIIWFEGNSSCRISESGKFLSTRCILRDVTDRKKTEQALHQMEEKFRLLAENAPDLIWQMDVTGKLTYISPSVKFLGYEPADWIGHQFFEFLPVEEREARIQQFPEELRSFTHRRREARVLNKDGVPVWMDVSASVVFDNGQPISIQGIARDLTERKKVEETLRESEERYRLLFEDNPHPIWVFDVDSLRFLAVNNTTIQNYGYSHEEFMSMSIMDIRPPEEIPVLMDTIAHLGPSMDKTGVWRHIKKDGTMIYAEVTAQKINFDGKNARLILAQDVSERKRIEANLRMQTSAINATSDQVVITNVHGKIEFVNPAFEEETGYTYDETVGKTHELFASGKHEAKFYADLWATINTGNTWHGEITNKRKDGSLYVEDMSITPVKNEAGIIERFIAIKRNITEKKMYEKQLDHLAHHDLLTGLPNRLLLSDKLVQRFAQARRQHQSLAVMFLDLDRFKFVNDTLGHTVGDLLLKEVAHRLSSNIREVDTVARMGGDEFIIIAGEIVSPKDAAAVAHKLLHALSDPFMLDNHELFISASIGISLYPEDGVDVETLVKNADTAMYRAKEQGRNRYHLYTEALNAAVVERMTLENSLRKALERNEFLLYYQPRVDITTGKTVGAEALVRWQHKELGLIPPNQFIPLAEETGLIVPISDWVLHEACAQNKAWQETGLSAIDIAVNISARLFQQEGLRAAIEKVVRETGLNPKHLELELTESTLMHNPELAIETLQQMKEMGVRISIDDFGTGYSSLSYLKRFPIDALKIDRSFVKEITTNTGDAAVATAVVAMARSLNLKVIAEGVETLEQLEFLRTLKCDEMQGYFVSLPVPPEVFAEHLRDAQAANLGDHRNAA